MSHATYNIEVYQGTDFSLKIRRKFEDEYTVMDGWTGAAQYRVSEDDGVAVDFTVTFEEDDTSWFALLTMSAELTATLEENGVWDLDLVDDNENHQTPIKGSVTVVLQVTR